MREKNSERKISNFENIFCYPSSLVLSLFGHNFCSQTPIEKKLYSYEDY